MNVLKSRGRRVGVLALVGIVVLSCGSIDDEELQCEEAVAHLEDCCPSFDPHRFSCQQTGCNGVAPAVTESAAECIRDRDCAELKSSGTCDRLIKISNQPYPSFATESIRSEACK